MKQKCSHYHIYPTATESLKSIPIADLDFYLTPFFAWHLVSLCVTRFALQFWMVIICCIWAWLSFEIPKLRKWFVWYKHVYLNNFTQIVYPAKVQEKQVEQLRTQVVDLERFVDFLQGILRKKFLLNSQWYKSMSCLINMCAGLTLILNYW